MRVFRVGIAGVLVASAVAVAARGARAEPPAKESAIEWAKGAIDALEKGNISQVADFGNLEIHRINVNDLAKDLDLALAFTKTVQSEAPRRVPESLQTVRVYMILGQQVATAMQQQKPKDFRSKRGGAYALIAQCRVLVVRATPTVFDDWLKAGDLAAESYETEAGQKDGGAFAVEALTWMRGAAALSGADSAAFQKRADALFAILGKFPDGPVTAVGKATAKLMAIDTLLRQATPPAPAALKPPLDEVVALLTPHAQPTGSLPACALWQECVTIARSRKVPGTKIDYLIGPPAMQLNITWQLPIGGPWKEVGPAGTDPAYVANIEQHMPDGRIQHRIEVRMFRWDKSYGIGESPPFKGDSPKELILAVQNLYKKEFSTVTSKKDVAKRDLAEGMSAQSFEMEGTSARTGEPMSVRVFVVRGKDTKGTFMVDAVTNGKAPPGDPELDAVLKTFREVKGGK